MTRIRVRVSTVVVAALLLALAAGARADQGEGNGNGDNHPNRKLRGTYTFRLVPATSFAPFVPASGVATAPRQDILRVGIFRADDAGTVTGRTIATTDDGLTTIKIDFNWSGTCTMDADGLGTLRINAPTAADINACVDGNNPPNPVTGCEAFEGAESYAFVVNRHGDDKVVGLIQTDNDGGGAKIFLTGDAKRR